MWTRENLLELIHTKLRDYRFILVSHREPYIHRYADGQVECEQPASGLTVALDPILRASGGIWTAHGSGDVVLYSDGVTESRNAEGEFFGRKRLREVVATHAKESCQAIHEAIEAAVAAFTEGAPQADDITVLVLEYAG